MEHLQYKSFEYCCKAWFKYYGTWFKYYGTWFKYYGTYTNVNFSNRQKSSKTCITCPEDRQKLDTDKVDGFKWNHSTDSMNYWLKNFQIELISWNMLCMFNWYVATHFFCTHLHVPNMKKLHWNNILERTKLRVLLLGLNFPISLCSGYQI